MASEPQVTAPQSSHCPTARSQPHGTITAPQSGRGPRSQPHSIVTAPQSGHSPIEWAQQPQSHRSPTEPPQPHRPVTALQNHGEPSQPHSAHRPPSQPHRALTAPAHGPPYNPSPIPAVGAPRPPSTCGNEVVHQRVIVVGAQQRAGEQNAVERHVVLGHEVVQLHLRGMWVSKAPPAHPPPPPLCPPPAAGSSTSAPSAPCSWQ